MSHSEGNQTYIFIVSFHLSLMDNLNMEENSGQAQGNRRLKWTDEINSTLLECKRKAVLMTKSNAPEAMDGNHKKGYMEIMKELWDQHGYEYLAIPRKNLQNQAARLEKSLGNAANNILDKVGRRQGDETKRNKISKIWQILIIFRQRKMLISLKME